MFNDPDFGDGSDPQTGKWHPFFNEPTGLEPYERPWWEVLGVDPPGREEPDEVASFEVMYWTGQRWKSVRRWTTELMALTESQEVAIKESQLDDQLYGWFIDGVLRRLMFGGIQFARLGEE